MDSRHNNDAGMHQSNMNMMANPAAAVPTDSPCPVHCGPFPNYCFEITNTPKKLISFLWIVTNVSSTVITRALPRINLPLFEQILGFCYIFCAIAVAAANDCDNMATLCVPGDDGVRAAMGNCPLDENEQQLTEDFDTCSRALGFYGVWDMFLVIILAIGGTLVMRMVRFRCCERISHAYPADFRAVPDSHGHWLLLGRSVYYDMQYVLPRRLVRWR
jgi:hypothetical protein